MKSYVYEHIEVKKTGRQATRTLSSKKDEVLVEITPVHDRDGTWHKWIPERVLFTVEDTKGDDND